MKVLFTSSWYPSKEHKTLGNFVERHALAASIQNDVYVLYVRSSVQKENFTFEIKSNTPVKTVIVYYKKVFNRFLTPLKFLRFHKGMKLGLKLLEKEFDVKTFDVCHHNVHFEAGIIPMYLKKKYFTPYIISEHWTGYLPSGRFEYKGVIRKWLTKKIGNNCDIQVPVSKDLGNSLQELGIATGKIKVVPNVVETSLFKNSEKTPIKNEVKLLHISTLDENQKNITGILRTFKKLQEVHPKSTLTIVGDGEPSHVEQTIKDLKLFSSVTLTKRQAPPEIARLLQEAHIFIMFSNYENLPCVIIEAMATGTPILSSTVGGIPEHLSKEFGELVEPKDEKALLNKLDYMIQNYSSYDGEVIRQYALDNFSYEKIGDQFTNIYKSLLECVE